MLLAAVLGGAVVGGACYSQSPAPPAFRNKCADDSECLEGESCVDSLCEVLCTQATFDEDCRGGNHVACFNGVCATGCPLNRPEVCPPAKECIDLGLSAGGGGFFGSATAIGLCGTPCDDADHPCPSGEVCFEGACVQTCVTADECADGFDCVLGFCIPPGVGGSDSLTGSDGITAGSDAGSSSSDAAASSGSGTSDGSGDTTAGGTGGAT